MDALRVGIDVSGLLWPDSGTGFYTTGLVRALLARPRAEYRLTFTGFRRSASESKIVALASHRAPVFPIRLPARILRLLWPRVPWPPLEWWSGPIDVFHTNDWIFPSLRAARTVATVFDLGALRHPELYPQDIVEAHRRKHAQNFARASRLLVLSEHTKTDLMEMFHLPASRITVAPCGRPDPRVFHPRADPTDPDVRSALLLEKPYLLYVGTFEPRKNVPRLLEAFAALPVPVGREVSLVLAGGIGWGGAAVQDAIERLHLNQSVRLLGHVPRPLLGPLMRGAEAFVFPSLYEGFGIPVVEAMACGTPVVASNATSLPELLGEAARYVDPRDPDSIRAGMLDVIESQGLRARLRRAGPDRAKRFSWTRSARLAFQSYREAAAS